MKFLDESTGALDRLDCALSFESGSKVVAEAAFAAGAVGTPSAGVLYIQALKLEPATRIERATCSFPLPYRSE